MEKQTQQHELRHTLAHLLAAAVLEIYPDAKPTIGPPVENGFYYDFEFPEPLAEQTLAKIEKRMRKLLPHWREFTHTTVSADEAKAHFPNNQYKQELIDELEAEGTPITLYTCGKFTDLCRGGHLEHPSESIDPGAFELDRIAGAYWRGDESNAMLTRIYGLAFEDKETLEKYKQDREEARKRDHRKLGKELDLFAFSDLIGSGLPLWTPKGTLLRDLLDEYVWSLRAARGYSKVEIPHITKKDLYEKSGHWSKFSDELFTITTREGHEFAMKPMNCPHHTQIFARRKWSYKDMPQRYANTTMCYRDEQSGELHGLSRVRALTQDDAHVFCREDQVKDEVFKIWDIIETFYKTFDFTLSIHLSVHDPKQMDRYLGDPASWEQSVETFRAWLEERNASYVENVGEAAFYGPKIDFIATDSLNRTWQVATIQVDRTMPESFDLTFTNTDGAEEQVVMIHAAIMGSIERFLSVLIEHTGGRFPFWLAPTQVVILPVSSKNHGIYTQTITQKLQETGIRVEHNDTDENLGKRIRAAKLEKIPYQIVCGETEMENNTVTLESSNGDKHQDIATEKAIAILKKAEEESY